MAESIRQCLTQRLYGNFELFLSANTLDDTTLVEMFEEERQTGIQQFKEVTIHPHIVDKHLLLCSTEPGHPQQELWISRGFLNEQCGCRVLNLAILYHRQLIQQCHG